MFEQRADFRDAVFGQLHPTHLAHEMAEPPPSDAEQSTALTVPRPVDDQSITFDLVAIDEAPEAAVVAAIAVITHHEVLAIGNFHRPEMITRSGWCRIVLIVGVRVVDLVSINEDGVVANFYRVAGGGDYALDEVFGW